MARRLPPASQGTKRRSAFIAQAPILLVVCEGKTEAKLLNELRARWRIPTSTIKLVPQVGVPSTVVREAKRLCQPEQPDETWVVFDRDEHPCWSSAIAEALQAAFKLAISNPCFEQWAILLHLDQRQDLHRHEVQRRLASVHPGYHHDKSPYLDVSLVLVGLEAAATRAAVINKIALSLDEPYRAPMTLFPDLIARLRALAR